MDCRIADFGVPELDDVSFHITRELNLCALG